MTLGFEVRHTLMYAAQLQLLSWLGFIGPPTASPQLEGRKNIKIPDAFDSALN